MMGLLWVVAVGGCAGDRRDAEQVVAPARGNYLGGRPGGVYRRTFGVGGIGCLLASVGTERTAR